MTPRTIQVDERVPLLRALPLSLQHLCAMFGAAVLVPFLFKVDPATSLLMNGVGTLVYLVVAGGRIPAYLGSSFAFIAPVMGGVCILLFGVIAAAGIRMPIERRVDCTRSRHLILTSLVLVAGVSGASVTIGTVALKGMALGTVVAIVLSLVLAVFDRLGLANDREHPALPARL